MRIIKILLVEESLNREYEIEKLKNYCNEIILLTELKPERKNFYSEIIQVDLKRWDLITSFVEKENQKLKFDCVIGFNEMSSELVDRVSKFLNLPAISSGYSEAYRNKDRMRFIFESNYLNTPRYRVLRNISEYINCIDFKFPVVVKPLGLAGSIGVQKVENYEFLEEKLKSVFEADVEIVSDNKIYSLCDIHEVRREAIVEEFIYGQEYSAECMIINGHFQILGITEKYTTKSNYLDEVAHIFPVSDIEKDLLIKIYIELEKYHKSLRFNFAYTHCEFKIWNDKIYVIEIGARPGGDRITQLMAYNCGFDAAKLYLNIRSNNLIEIPKCNYEKFVSVYFISAPEETFGKIYKSIDFNQKELKIIEESYYYKQGEMIETPKFWGQVRLGHIIFETNSIEKSREIISKINEQININIFN